MICTSYMAGAENSWQNRDDAKMLRIQFKALPNTVTMRIEGRLVGDFAEDARKAIAASKLSCGFVVDLSSMTFADDTGEKVLRWLQRTGAKFTAKTAYSHDVCERLHLPMTH